MGRFLGTYLSFIFLLLFSVSDVNGQLNASFTSTDQNQCPGNLFTLSASNPTYSNYAWTITGPSGFNSSLSGSSIVVFLNNSGFYNVTLTVTDAGVSTTNSQNGYLEVYSPPTINYNLSTTSGCSPLSVIYNGSSTPGSGTLQSFAINSANGTISNSEDFSVIYNSAGVYNPTATVTNSFGCFTTMNLPAITVLQAPSLTSPLNSNSVCSGSLFNYGFSSSMPGTTYSWTRAQVVGISPNSGNGNGDISEILINNTLNSIVVPYVVTLTAPNGCVSVQTINVTVRALPTVSANTTNINICEGQTTNLIATGSVPNGQFSWSTGEETNAITVATAGNYSVTFNNGICTSLPLNINVNTIVAPSVNLSNTENSGIANNDASICAGSTVQLTASPAVAGGTYLWMPGNLTTQSISVSPLSTTVFTLVYTLGCPSISDSITVVVNNLPINTFTASTSNACSAPVTTAFTSTTLNANGALTTWNFPGASSPSTGIGAGPIAVTYNSSGNYSISMTSTSLDGCSSTSVFPSAITVGNGAPPSSSFVNLTSVTQCVNADNYCFQYTGSGADTILLDFGNGFSDFFDPSVSYCYSYPVLGNYTVSMTPYTTVGNALGCSGSTSQVNVIVTGPQANFTTSAVDCSNQLTRSFSSTSAGVTPLTVYTWNFGDGSPTINSQSVSHTFLNYGTYNVNLTVSDLSTGCLPTQHNFVVNANPNNLADFQSNAGGVLSSDVCIGSALQFVNTTPVPQYNSGVAPASFTSINTLWDWNTNNGISFANTTAGFRGTPRSRTFNSPTYSPGNYGVGMLNVDNNGCNDTVTHIIHIHGVTGGFVAPDTICNGLSFSATDNSLAPNGSIVSRVWDWGDGTPNTTGNIINPTHVYSVSGNYTITLTVTDDFGCTKISTKNVTVRKPFASFSVDQDFICNNQTVSVSANSFGFGSLIYNWNASNASPTNVNGSNPGPFTFVQQGNQTISLTVSDDLGCIDDTIIPITVLDVTAGGIASANSFACFNPPNVVSFTNTSSNNPDVNSAQWDFGNGQTSTNWNPSTVYSLPGTYNVTLIVSSMPTSSGAVCRDTQQVVIVNIGGPNGTIDVTNSSLTGCSCYLASIDVNTTGATEAKLLFGNGAFVDLIPNTVQTITYSYCNTGTTQLQFVPSLFLSNGACFGYIPSLDTIRIQPTPTVNAITNQVFCANSTTNTVNFSSPVVNTTFNWTNSNAAIGLAASGSGSISPFVGLNSTSNQQNATISVTPIANGCPGNPVNFTYSINALATINAGIDQTVCGNSTVTLAGTQGGSTTSVTWSGGTGTFSPNSTTLNAVYTPSATEINVGSVTLTLTSNDPSGPCTSVSDQVVITINQPATVDAGIDQTICGSTPVTLAGAQGGSATSITWSGGTGIFSPNATILNATYTPSAADVTSGSVTLTITSNNPAGPCPAATDQVLITIAQPATINAGIDQTICGNSTVTLSGTQGGSTTSATWSGGTGTFSPNSTTLNAVYTPSAAEINAGSVTLTLTSNDPSGPCPSVSDQVLITINQPATVDAGIDQTICGSTPVTLAGAQGGVTTSITWSGGTGIFSPNAATLNATYTPSAADVTAGSVTLTITSNNPAGPCPAATDQVLITIAQPAIISAGIDQTICGNSTVTLAGTQGGSTTSATWSGGTGTFSPNATSLNAVYTPSPAEINSGNVTLTLTSNDPVGPCVAVSDQVLITINQSATVNAGIDQTICGSTPVTLAGAQGGSATSITWSGGTGIFSPNATTLNATYTPSAADVTSGSVTLTITSNNPAGPCPAATDQVLITIALPATINAGIDQTICGNSTVTLSGTQGGSTTSATWSGGTGTFSPNSTALNAVYTPSAAEINAGSVTLTLTSNDPIGPCGAVSDQVLITINQPATVDAGIDQTICGSTPVTLAGAQGGSATSITWSGGTGIFSPNATTLNATYTPSAADVTAGSVTLTITSNNPAGPCPAATDQVLITIAQPATINAGIDQTICGNSTVTLAGTQGGSTTSATWSGGTGTFSPNSTTLNAVYTPSAAEINAGSVTLTLTSNDPSGPCPSVSDQVLITINQPATADAGIDQTVCGSTPVTLSGTQGGSATSITWSGGTGIFSPNATTLNATYTPSAADVTAGSVTLTITTNNPAGPCPAATDQVLITIAQPATINAGIDQTICGNSTVTLSGTQGGSTTSATWSGGTGTFSPNSTTLNAVYTPSAAEINAGSVTLTLTSNDPIGPCGAVSDQVLITIAQPATISAGIDQTICGTSIVALSGTLGGSATSGTWSGGTGTFSPNSTNLNATYTPSVAEINAGSVILTLTSNDPSGPCVAVSDQVLIIINQAATISAGIDQTICGTSTVTLAGTQGGSTTLATWSGGAGTFSPNATTLNAVYTPSAAEISAGSVTLTLTSNDPIGPCGGVSDQVLITIAQPATISAGIDQTICGTSIVALSGTLGGSAISGTWSGGAGTFSPNATNLNAIYTPSVAEINAGSVILTLTSNDPTGPCPLVSDQVLITINQAATINAGIDQTICGITTVSLAGTQGGSTTSATWSGGTGTFSPNATTLNAVYTPSPAEINSGNVTLTLTSNDPVGPCVAVSDQVLITINQSATVNAGIDQTICGAIPVTLSGAQGGATTGITWSGGTGTFSPNTTTLNAIYTPSAADLAAGSVTLTITSNDPAGPCAAVSDQVLITMNALPVILSQDTVILCSGDNLNYPIITDVASNIAWNATDNPIVTGETITVQNSNFIGDNLVNPTNNIEYVTYNFDLTSFINGCQSDNQMLIVQVNPLPIIDSIGDLFYCDGVVTDPIVLGSNILNTNFSWTNSNPSIGLAGNGLGNIPSFTPNNNSPTDISATITVIPENAGCQGNSFDFTITIGPVPNVGISPAGPYCVSSPSEVMIADVGNGFWSGPGIVNSVTGEFDPSFANIGVNIITYTLNGVCGGGSSIDILVYPNPEASFTADNFSTTVLDPVFHFENTSVNATTYTWNFGDGTGSTLENPTQIYPEVIGYYLVELIATNSSGCVDTATNFVYVEEETIFYVPNAFSPDGNEVNNVFYPVFSEGYDPDYYSLRIFNRWGEVVFETTKVTEGWDGTYKGEMCQDGTYVWSISFKAATSDLVHRHEGHVVLIK